MAGKLIWWELKMFEHKNVAAKTNLTEAETTVCFTQS